MNLSLSYANKNAIDTMKIYLDTSVLVSLYILENHSEAANSIVQANHQIYISSLNEVEFYSALALKKRLHKKFDATIKLASNLFKQHIEERLYEKLHITDSIFITAINYLASYKTSLRALDALHLACSATTGINLVTADKNLAKSASLLNIPNMLI